MVPSPTVPLLPRAVVALGALVLLTSGCTGDPGAEDPRTDAPSTAVPLDQVEVSREDLCGAVEEDLVVAGLPDDESLSVQLVSWGNGDPVGGDPDHDLGLEVGCTWRVGERARDPFASVWVFVPPVKVRAARAWARAEPPQDCRTVPVTFGQSGTAWTCRESKPRETVRWAGLFGDAWLTCELQGPGAVSRAETFCPGVVRAAATG